MRHRPHLGPPHTTCPSTFKLHAQPATIESQNISADTTVNSKYKPLYTLFLSMLCALVAAASSAATDTAAIDLAQAVYDRPSGDDSSARVLMVLKKKEKIRKKRLLYTYGIDKGNSERWTLMRFIQPADVDRTGLLTLDHMGDDSDQWLYLPALDKVRRISSKRKGGRFVGSDFFYEDLSDREVNMDHHRLIGSDKVGGVDCTLLESIPVKKSNSVYSKRVSCIHTGLKLPLRIDFYQKKDKPVKRLRARKIKKVQGYWTIFESTMYNLKKDTETQLITTDIVYDQGIPDDLFSQRGLSDDSQEIQFRPKKQPEKKPK